MISANEQPENAPLLREEVAIHNKCVSEKFETSCKVRMKGQKRRAEVKLAQKQNLLKIQS